MMRQAIQIMDTAASHPYDTISNTNSPNLCCWLELDYKAAGVFLP